MKLIRQKFNALRPQHAGNTAVVERLNGRTIKELQARLAHNCGESA